MLVQLERQSQQGRVKLTSLAQRSFGVNLKIS